MKALRQFSWFGILSVIVLNVSIVNANSSHGDQLTLYDAAGGFKCYICNRGMYWIKDCVINGTQAVCSPCPMGKFNNHPGVATYCETCTPYCLIKNAYIIKNCTAQSDIVCHCDPGYYKFFRNKASKTWSCERHKACGIEFGVEKEGTAYENTICVKCVRGSYSNISSRTEGCLACSECTPPLVEITSCNGVNDTVCGMKYDPFDLDNHQHEKEIHEKKKVIKISVATVFSVLGAIVIAIVIIVVLWKKRQLKCFQKNTDMNMNDSLDEKTISVVNLPTDLNPTSPLSNTLSYRNLNEFSSPPAKFDISLVPGDVVYITERDNRSAGAIFCPDNGDSYLIPNSNQADPDGIDNAVIDAVEADAEPIPDDECLDMRNEDMSENSTDRTNFASILHSRTDVSGKISENTWTRLFCFLSPKLIADDWKFIFRELYGDGADNCIIEAQVNYPNDIKEVIYNCLMKWKQSSENPTLEDVIKVLRANGKTKIVSEIEKYYLDLS